MSDLDNQLLAACKEGGGDVAKVTDLLKRGANIHTKDKVKANVMLPLL